MRFIILRALFSTVLRAGFPLFPRRGIAVLQHELGCYTKKTLTAIYVLDMLRKMFL